MSSSVIEIPFSSSEHRNALSLSNEIARCGTDNDRLQACWSSWREQYHKKLVSHFREEEEMWLSMLVSSPDGNLLAQRLLTDHKRMELLLSLESLEPFQILQFSEVLRAHVIFEEQELFGWLQQNVDLGALLQLFSKSSAQVQ